MRKPEATDREAFHIPHHCPLCFTENHSVAIKSIDNRSFSHCRECDLIWVRRDFLLSAGDEKKQYLHHNNGIQYPGYVKFLNQAIEEIRHELAAGMRSLDYGCGPEPTLSILLEREGLESRNFDPLFFPDLPAGPFDFVFATESAEHFYEPAKEIVTINKLLNPGGFLILMTEKWTRMEDFPTWYYANDATHVSFYSDKTFAYVCDHFGFEMCYSKNPRVVVLKKQGIA